MVRATIKVGKPEQLLEAYTIIKKNQDMNIIKVDCQLAGAIKQVLVNVVYMGSIICEIILRFG